MEQSGISWRPVHFKELTYNYSKWSILACIYTILRATSLWDSIKNNVAISNDPRNNAHFKNLMTYDTPLIKPSCLLRRLWFVSNRNTITSGSLKTTASQFRELFSADVDVLIILRNFFFSNVAILGNSRAPVSFNRGFKIKQIHSAYVRQDLHIQQVLTILDLLTTVPFITGMWRLWVVTCPREISAVAQHTPIWPTGVKPFSDPGNLITNTPTSASWFSVGWIAIADSGFCTKNKDILIWEHGEKRRHSSKGDQASISMYRAQEIVGWCLWECLCQLQERRNNTWKQWDVDIKRGFRYAPWPVDEKKKTKQ